MSTCVTVGGGDAEAHPPLVRKVSTASRRRMVIRM
jgi:hypothetical protein